MRIDEILLSDDKKQRRLSELYRVFGGREARLLAVIELLMMSVLPNNAFKGDLAFKFKGDI